MDPGYLLIISLSKLPRKIDWTEKGSVKFDKDHLGLFLDPNISRTQENNAVSYDWVRSSVPETSPCPPPSLDPQLVHKSTFQVKAVTLRRPWLSCPRDWLVCAILSVKASMIAFDCGRSHISAAIRSGYQPMVITKTAAHRVLWILQTSGASDCIDCWHVLCLGIRPTRLIFEYGCPVPSHRDRRRTFTNLCLQ